ncbi:MAG: sulfite exporter TauE/SafE family protein [Candidatus Cyclobacteriaceae bacterium M2_1C_046]
MILASALILGFLSSWHCIGMCGPLAMAVNHGGGRGPWYGAAIYHSGRILIYAGLGVLMGLLGMATYMLKLQQYFSFLLGAVVIILIFRQSWLNKLTAKYQKSRFMQFIRKNVLNKRNFRSKKGKFISGMANGLLPCGMVYVALAGALAQPAISSSVIYMLMFGLGTLPALMATQFIPLGWARKPFFKKWAYAGMLVISCLFFYRALHTHQHEAEHQHQEISSPFAGVPVCGSL